MITSGSKTCDQSNDVMMHIVVFSADSRRLLVNSHYVEDTAVLHHRQKSVADVIVLHRPCLSPSHVCAHVVAALDSFLVSTLLGGNAACGRIYTHVCLCALSLRHESRWMFTFRLNIWGCGQRASPAFCDLIGSCAR